MEKVSLLWHTFIDSISGTTLRNNRWPTAEPHLKKRGINDLIAAAVVCSTDAKTWLRTSQTMDGRGTLIWLI